MVGSRRSVDRFRQFLHSRSLRVTGLREDIVRAAFKRRGHFDSDELVDDLRAEGIRASRASVYRVLPLLVEAGILKRTVSSGERRRYEAALGHDHHDHLVCTHCGTVVEFCHESVEVLQREVARTYGFRLTGHAHDLFGVCATCDAKETKSLRRTRSTQPRPG